METRRRQQQNKEQLRDRLQNKIKKLEEKKMKGWNKEIKMKGENTENKEVK